MSDNQKLTGEVLDAIDVYRAKAVQAMRDMIGDYTRDSPQVRLMISEVIPSYSEAEVRWASKDPDFHWCGIAVLSALHRAGVTRKPWRVGSGFVLVGEELPVIRNPLPGDIFIGPPKAYHHGMVVERSISRDGHMMLRSIEGNAGIKGHCIGNYRIEPRGLTYYSIEPMILEALGLK